MDQIVSRAPHRTPAAVAEALADLLRDRVFCDLGCAHGDLLVFAQRYARAVRGVEHRRLPAMVAQRRGLDVVPAAFEALEALPPADVHYFWCGEERNLYLLRRLLAEGFRGVAVAAVGDKDAALHARVLALVGAAGKVRSVPYDEGPGERESGVFNVVVVDMAQLAKAREDGPPNSPLASDGAAAGDEG